MPTVAFEAASPDSDAKLQQSVWFRRDKHHFKMQRDDAGMQQAYSLVRQQASFTSRNKVQMLDGDAQAKQGFYHRALADGLGGSTAGTWRVVHLLRTVAPRPW